jgi:hypothetical protein
MDFTAKNAKDAKESGGNAIVFNARRPRLEGGTTEAKVDS